MSRVSIELPEHLPFRYRITTRITDLNYGAHVGNDRFLVFAHEARVAFLEHHGYSELNMEGVGVIMSDAAVQFKAEVRAHEELEILVGASDFSRVGFHLYYKIHSLTSQKTTTLCKTGLICFDYEKKKVAALPEQAMRKLQS